MLHRPDDGPGSQRSHRSRKFPLALACAFVLAGCDAKEAIEKLGAEKVDLAQRETKVIVSDCYPTWLMSHPDKSCPTAADLADQGCTVLTDPWKRPYRIVCSGKGITASSLGFDGELGTADDITSASLGAHDRAQ